MGQSRPLFVYFRYFLKTISIIQIEKSVDGVLEIRTLGRRMVGADKTMEKWQPPLFLICYSLILAFLIYFWAKPSWSQLELTGWIENGLYVCKMSLVNLKYCD